MPARFVYADSVGMVEARQHIARLRAFLKQKKIDQTTFHLLASFYYTDERIRLFSDAFPHLMYVFKNHRELPYPAEQLAILCKKFGNTTSQLTKFFVDQAYRTRAGM
ncbi:MAG: hypothetical protein GXO82_06625 [Chlorobi bacterium]|nr:hypothetical protein [Chlorobiota bacterium]